MKTKSHFLSTIIMVFLITGFINAQDKLNCYKVGIGLDLGYRSPYANNNWMPGASADFRVNASRRFASWEPEIYFRKNIFNLTDRLEYHDGKSYEFGVNGYYHLNNEHHVFLGGLGLNTVSYQQYDYNAAEGWTETKKRGKARSFVYQIAYRFNFIKNKAFEPGITISYHNIRKLQIGFNLNYKIRRK